ncbi:HTTM domain-containing protein [Loktanella agnita]|uniref:HTTM domain-containing protein n=1 Tax=Loktanella agnita TaxID=287097 RepID=UPI003986A65D
MTLDACIHLTQILMALAFIQAGLEHLTGPADLRNIHMLRIGLSVALLIGAWPLAMLAGLALTSLWLLRRFDGPYNGGSDKMGLLVLFMLLLAELVRDPAWQERILAYLGFQVIMSYFISGQVKIINPDWRSGAALRDVFAFSAYPVSETLRQLAHRPRLLCAASWVVMMFEVLFPIALLDQRLLFAALFLGALFHLANACLFGLNRFFWIWPASYPALIWLQARLF